MLQFQEVTYIPDLKSTSILREKKLRGCDKNQKHTTCLGCQITVPQTSPSDSSSVIIKIRHFIRVRHKIFNHFGVCFDDIFIDMFVSFGIERLLQL